MAVGAPSLLRSPEQPLSRGSGNIAEEEEEKSEELEDGEQGGEVLTSGQDLAVAHINSQQLWLSTQNKASRKSSTDGRWAQEGIGSWWLLGKGEYFFLRGVAIGRLSVNGHDLILVHMGSTDCTKKYIFFEKREIEGHWVGMLRGRLGRVAVGQGSWYDQNTMLVCLVVSKNKQKNVKVNKYMKEK